MSKENLVINKQLASAKYWTNEEGFKIETKRLTKLEKAKEVKSYQLVKQALSIHKNLSEFKEKVREECQEIYELFLQENAATSKAKNPPKGNFTWYNFDQTLKIEVSISQPISFDDMGIQEVKTQLENFLKENVDSKIDFLQDLVLAAFETTSGKLDSKKVMSLLRYRSKIPAPKFQSALDLLEKSITRPKTKTYFRVWVRDENGQYQNIDLNFSSIN